MNDFQRQLLSDKLNDVGRSIERYQEAITKLQSQLLVKQRRLADLKKEHAELSEGVDW